MPWFPPSTGVAMSGDWPRGWYRDESDQPDAGGQDIPGSPGRRAQPSFMPSPRGPGGARDWYGAGGGGAGGAGGAGGGRGPVQPPSASGPRGRGPPGAP